MLAEDQPRAAQTHEEASDRSSEQVRVLRDGLRRARGVEHAEELLQVVLHQAVKKDLVLVSGG